MAGVDEYDRTFPYMIQNVPLWPSSMLNIVEYNHSMACMASIACIMYVHVWGIMAENGRKCTNIAHYGPIWPSMTGCRSECSTIC